MLVSHFSTPSLERRTTASLRSFTRFISTVIELPRATPYSAARRAMCATRALAIKVLVGMQPVLTHVPPKALRSMTATFIPAPARREVT